MLRRDLEKARERLTGELGGTNVEDWLGQMEAIEEALDPADGEAASRAKAAAAAAHARDADANALRACGDAGEVARRTCRSPRHARRESEAGAR